MKNNDKMLTTIELSDRWGLSADCLRRWRGEGTGPQYVKLGKFKKSPILYRLQDIMDYEEQNIIKPEEAASE